MYMYSTLSLQCIIGRFSTVVVFVCFVCLERLCSRVLVYMSRNKSKTGPEWQFFSVWFIVWMIFWSISWEDGSQRTDWMGMKTPCLGAHLGSLKKTLVAQTHNLGAPGARAPVRQQPCCGHIISKWLAWPVKIKRARWKTVNGILTIRAIFGRASKNFD